MWGCISISAAVVWSGKSIEQPPVKCYHRIQESSTLCRKIAGQRAGEIMRMVTLADIPEEGVSHDPQLKKQVMIRDGELPHLRKFARTRFPPGEAARAHSHDGEYEIFLIESGEGLVKVEGREYRVEAGICVVFEPAEVHEVVNTGAEQLVITYFGISV